MTNFHKPGAGLKEQRHPDKEPDELLAAQLADDESARRPRESIGEIAGRVSRWFQGLDPEPVDGETVEHDMVAELDLEDEEVQPRPRRFARTNHGNQPNHGNHSYPVSYANNGNHMPSEDDDPLMEPAADTRFPLVRYGYSQSDVDRELMELEHELAAREREIEELRDNQPPMSVAEELERIGEQTASILVVAHDQAHQTTRRAEEQAERCIADAAANAVQITAEAKARLRELDEETDAVWRERERLLEDTRSVSKGLATLVDEAIGRFPAAADKLGNSSE